MKQSIQQLKYILADASSAAVAWALFFISRKIFIESPQYGLTVPVIFNKTLLLGLLLIPAYWVVLYFVSGYYHHIFRKSRLNDIFSTFSMSLLGIIPLFLIFILDDYVLNYHSYYESLFLLFSYHFVFTLFLRLIITSRLNHGIHKGKVSFKTLLVGSGPLAVATLQQLKDSPSRTGHSFVGYVALAPDPWIALNYMGTHESLDQIIIKEQVREVVIAESNSSQDQLLHILDKLDYRDVIIKASADLYEDLKRITRVQTLYMTPLIGILHESMPVWQQKVKLIFDVVFTIFVLILTSPAFLFIAIGLKLTSKGPVIFKQERIGRHGTPFTLYKFRSMHLDAEKSGPQLSQKEDCRTTSFGKFLRRTKLDELPNFINVLKGDLAIVGPRSERKFFIDQIVPLAPHYLRLLKVKPGITSMGQIKFGYASNVEEMIKRLRYDIIYIENMSLYQDFKVLFYTFFTVIKGKGV